MADDERTAFRRMVEADIRDVFLNPEEFGEVMRIDGRDICVSLQPVDAAGFGHGPEIGLDAKDYMLYAMAEDLPPRKAEGSVLTINGGDYTVIRWNVRMGMACLRLRRWR